LLELPERIEVLALLPDYPPAAFIWRRVRRRVVRADGPERIAGEWWRTSDEVSTARDYYCVEDDKGGRFWIFRDAPASEGGRWFLHGIFA
jgi:protein ImuB